VSLACPGVSCGAVSGRGSDGIGRVLVDAIDFGADPDGLGRLGFWPRNCPPDPDTICLPGR